MSILFFILGLLVGSFINALVYRLYCNLPFVIARSHCPKCKQILTWYELIPLVSFFIQRGKCNTCKQKISWQYPIVELSTGLLFFLLYFSFIPHFLTAPSMFWLAWQMVGYYILTIFLIIIFIYDLKYYLILDKISFPAMAVALLWQVVADFSWQHILNVLLAGIIAGGFFFLQFAISKGKWIGGGDIRLGLLMGFILGWPNVLVALALSYFIGAGIALVLLAFNKKKWSSQIPFGTFLTIGTLLALLYSPQIINWYLSKL